MKNSSLEEENGILRDDIKQVTAVRDAVLLAGYSSIVLMITSGNIDVLMSRPVKELGVLLWFNRSYIKKSVASILSDKDGKEELIAEIDLMLGPFEKMAKAINLTEEKLTSLREAHAIQFPFVEK